MFRRKLPAPASRLERERDNESGLARKPPRHRKGKHRGEWTDEKEINKSLGSLVKRMKPGTGHTLSGRSLGRFRTIIRNLNQTGEGADDEGILHTFLSTLTNTSLSPDAAISKLRGLKWSDGSPDQSQIRSIDSGSLGAVVTIPNTPTRVQTPARIVVAGPSMCGKTYLINELLRRRNFIFTPTPPRVFWFYAMEDSVTALRNEFTDITFIHNLPTQNWVKGNVDPEKGALFIIDDLMGDATGRGVSKQETREFVMDMFTKGSHHNKVSIIFTVQNLFSGPNMRAISLNASQTVLFNNNRDVTHVRTLGTQLLGAGENGAPFLTACMAQVKKETYGYLWIEHSAKVDSEAYQFRTHILKDENEDKQQQYFVPAKALDDVNTALVTASRPLNRGPR